MLMKQTSVLRRFSLVALFSIMLAVSFTSCDDDYYWDPAPPVGYGDFWDSRLTGYWQLVGINGYTVSGTDTNYMFFNGSGRGVYYYYLNGGRYTELTAYWCQRAVVGATRFQMNLLYSGNSSATTVNYWFADGGRQLYMQWRDQSGVETYLYNMYPGAPW